MISHLVRRWVSLAVVGVLMMSACESADIPAWCEQQWFARSAEHTDTSTPDYHALLEIWKQYGEKCHGTVAYDARLALIYVYLDQPLMAKKVLKSISDDTSRNNYLPEFVRLLMDAKELVHSGQLNEIRLKEIDSKFFNFVKKYPEHAEGYGTLGAVESELGRHDNAIRLFEQALKRIDIPMQKWGIYRNLTISYAEVGRYQEAYDAASATISLRKEVTSDEYFMYALAKANAGLGRFSDARNDLKLIAAKKPEVKNTPDFVSTLDFVINKIKQSDKSGELQK